ncbi:50S ribosomal protein L1 [Candidatus Uhrbacteria bacterium CG22_combo_CG10-13_8_21_14_all_47_17]|uniref:Large ribosomal subunit protein uL1 n=1 Tax=Candidatus Uhrbacteria bacterium CG22_combo_CG10-13_8_21_14_all_47_17 TaxID=1975041 RepID=A0A2H0BSR5_9BACT|nr:MAG: 50S ribosomal protein L1 [Candidatus Uhrbacteria bacterium CG22_combo_CG10-13_8_21_14_all_47_17]
MSKNEAKKVVKKSTAHSKRYTELKKLVDPKNLYSPEEAIALGKQTSTLKFIPSLEAHFKLGIDVKKSDQQVRGTFIFPHSIGKTKRVAAFVNADKEKEATEAGANIIGGEELIAEIAKSGKIDFDVAVATPDMMPKLAKIAKILGPVGLMPNPKTDTVSPNVKKMIEDVKKGKVAFKNDATGNVHHAFGKTDLDDAKLMENLKALVEAVKKMKPSSSKGVYLKSMTITSTMGPGIPVDTAKFA